MKEEYANKDLKWLRTGGLKPCMAELVRLTLEAGKEPDVDKVLVSWLWNSQPMRNFLWEGLLNGGAKYVTVVFLHCDFDAHMQALWERTHRWADQADTTIDEMFKMLGMEGIVTFDSFVEFMQPKKGFCGKWEDPDKSLENLFKIGNVTAKDMSVLDNLDAAFKIQDNNRSELSYQEIVPKVREIDSKQDQKMMDSIKKNEMLSLAKQELTEKEPEKYAARRSSLLWAE